MTKQQTELLLRVYEAHRYAWAEGDRRYGYAEVGWINGVNPRTARALEDAGLLVEEAPPGICSPKAYYVRLPLPLPGEDEARFIGREG